MSLVVIQPLGDDEFQAELMLEIGNWYTEVRAILPKLPEDLQIYFFAQDNPGIMAESGVGGYAYSSSIMSLGFLLDFPDKIEQMKQLRSTVFHEALHISQGYVGGAENISVIECAVYEGLATVFEREFVGINQPYGDYPKNEKIIQEWFSDMSKIKTPWDYFEYSNWAFTDKKTGERWRLYKTGTWIIDQILLKHRDITVLDLTKMNAKHILKLEK